MQKLPIIDHAINIHLPNKVVYPHPLITPNNLSSQHEHQYSLNWTQACEATFCKTISNFCKYHKQIRIH
jgi:hypothetical protein